MNKEQVLKLMKEVVLHLKDNTAVLMEDENIRNKWLEKSSTVKAELDKMNSCDLQWLDEQYTKFFKDRIEPAMTKELKEEISKVTE